MGLHKIPAPYPDRPPVTITPQMRERDVNIIAAILERCPLLMDCFVHYSRKREAQDEERAESARERERRRYAASRHAAPSGDGGSGGV